MTTKVAYRVIYNRTGKFDQQNKASVIIEAYQNGARRYFKTGIRLLESELDKVKNQVKGNPPFNRLIRSRITELENFELDFSNQHKRPFTLNDFDLLEPPTQPDQEVPTLTDFMLKLIERDKGKWTTSTYYHYKRTVQNLLAFNGGKPVPFDALTYSFVEAHDSYLRTRKRYSQNTIYKAHQIIHKYVVKAERMGLAKTSNNPYNEFEFDKASAERVVLYTAEIARIENLTFSKEQAHLAFYRDAFLFAYYTLLRISDVTALRQSHLIRTDKGLVMELKAQKTGKLRAC